MTLDDSTHVIVIGGGASSRAVSERLQAGGVHPLSVSILSRETAFSATSGVYHGGTCVSLTESPDGVVARFANGRTVVADAAILATGCASFATPGDEYLLLPNQSLSALGKSEQARLTIIGSGSEAVLYTLRALADGHKGSITLLSRTGLLPRDAKQNVLELSPADIPLGTALHYLLRWFRSTVQWADEHDYDLQSVVEGLRPHLPLIWQHLPNAGRRQYVRHVRSLWDAASQVVSSEQCAVIKDAIGSGQVSILRGSLAGVVPIESAFRMMLRRRGDRDIIMHDTDVAVNCDGAPPGIESYSTPIIAGLIARGLARPDSMLFGLDVTNNCALIDASGQPSQCLYAIGPPTRGYFIDALDVARIKKQSQAITRAIARSTRKRAA